MSIVELKDVCKTYPAFRLKNVSFALEEGRITGFIGRNGAGKISDARKVAPERRKTVIRHPIKRL